MQDTLTYVIKACDVLFGSTAMSLAALGTWQYIAGAIHAGTMIALWLVPAFNLVWTQITRNRDRVRSDYWRGVLCIPLAAYVFAAEKTGLLSGLWLPALMVCVGAVICSSIGLGTARHGIFLTFGYVIAMLAAVAIRDGEIFDVDAFSDATGLLLVGVITSLVASYLGRTLRQLSDRSTALSTAIETLHQEMERRRKVEADLVQAQKLESVGRLAAGIAHEINTPVQFVNDSLHFVRDAVTELFLVVDRAALTPEEAERADLPFLSDEVPKALARAEDGLVRVSTIVRSMNEFAHPDAAEMQDVDLNHAINATLTVARNEYKYVADLTTDFGELPPVNCFAGELNQVVLNIVVNAAHAIGDVVGTSGARGTLRVSTRAREGHAVISIADSGGGIPETIRHRIFDPFFTTKGIGRGTGQGLAIARTVIVEKHLGKISFESVMGTGTTFTIEIPIAGARSAAA